LPTRIFLAASTSSAAVRAIFARWALGIEPL
jgi:hypothetical protein